MKHSPNINSAGVYAGISNSEYHGGPGISKSGLDIINRSPAHFYHAQNSERKPSTPDQQIGTLTHSLVLEPETFWDEYARPFNAAQFPDALVTNDDVKARLKDLNEKVSGRKDDLIERLRAADPEAIFLDDCRAEHERENDGKTLITEDQLATAEAMRDAINAHPKAGKLFTDGQAELSVYWTDDETGVLCRCRPDYLRNDGVVVDLKTALDASEDAFPRSVEKWRYHVQAAFYLDGLRAAKAAGADIAEPRAFVFVAVEKTAPYAVGVYVIDAEAIEIGRREYRQDLARYAECLSAEHWPAYSDRIEPISLPEWRLRREAFEQGDAA